MNLPRRAPLFLVVTLVALAQLAQGGIAHAGKGGKGQDILSKVVEINRQALAQLQAGRFDAARDALWGAIVALNEANLSEHEIAARTHVHLAAVYMTGFNDRTKAIKQFVMALKINPNIKITPQVETAALDEAFDAARGQAGLAAAPRSSSSSSSAGASDSAAPPVAGLEDTGSSATGSGRRGQHAKKVVDEEEPPPPAKVSAPLFCPLPNEVPPKEDIMLRCTTQKKPRQASATLFYRQSGSEEFTSIPMTRSARGWQSATIPASAVTGNAVQFYITAKVPGVKEALAVGSSDGPNILPIVAGASPMNNAGLILLLRGENVSTAVVAEEDDKAPLEDINRQYKIDEDLRKYHRRYVGSWFFAFGGGTGITYHGKTKADGQFYNSQTNQPINALPVGAGTNPASIAQAVLELGYVVNEKLAISVQGRFQYVPYDSTGQVKGTPPPTLAMAGFLRGQYNFLTVANFQLFASGMVGGGPRTFMGYIPKTCDSSGYNPNCRAGTDHSNIVSAGKVAGGVGIGFLYHLTRWMGFWIEGRGMSSVAPIMLLAEANAGLSFSLKIEKSAPPPAKEEGGWEKPPEEDKPLFEAPPGD